MRYFKLDCSKKLIGQDGIIYTTLDRVRERERHPYMRFATDMIYFIIHADGLDWEPFTFIGMSGAIPQQNRIPYCVYPHGLFSELMQKATKEIISQSVVDYKKIYDKIVPADEERIVECFVNHIDEELYKFTSAEIVPSSEELFLKLVYIGRLTSEFYKSGTKIAADLVTCFIERVLFYLEDYQYSRTFFDEMNRVACDIIVDLKYPYFDGEGFSELAYEDDGTFDKDPDDESDLRAKSKSVPKAGTSRKGGESKSKNQNQSASFVGPPIMRARYRPGMTKVYRIANVWRHLFNF